MLVCVCCDLTQASNFRLRLHGTGRIIFNRLKNLTGYFVHTGLFDIFALFTWKYEQRLYFDPCERNTQTNEIQPVKIRPVPCERSLNRAIFS